MRSATLVALAALAAAALSACNSHECGGVCSDAPPVVTAPPAAMNPGAAGMAAPAQPLPANTEPMAMQPSIQNMQPAPSADAGSHVPSDPATEPMTTQPSDPPPPMLAMDECKLHTKWDGDEYCILPPPAEQGFQVHIGPTDYDNPEPKYVIEPGEETTESFPAVAGNAEDVYYYFRQYRMRPGSHHLIISSTGGGGGGEMGHRLGGSQNLAADNPVGGEIPPENEDVGDRLAAKTPLSVQLHYINSTMQPLIKEAWVNFWYRDDALVKQPAYELYLSGGGINVAPNTHVVLNYEVPVMGDGRILRLYGHGHAHNVRFSAWRVRGAKRDVIYEDFDWADPAVFEYNSLTENPLSDPIARVAGGWSGPLDIHAGDTLEFECEVDNTAGNGETAPTTAPLTFANESQTGEMCILIGDSVGIDASVPPLSFSPKITQL